MSKNQSTIEPNDTATIIALLKELKQGFASIVKLANASESSTLTTEELKKNFRSSKKH